MAPEGKPQVLIVRDYEKYDNDFHSPTICLHLFTSLVI